MIKNITTEALKNLRGTEGLVLQGCGGDPREWANGINETLTNEGMLLDGDMFSEIYVFEHDGLTNMMFSMDDVKLDVGKLAVWRLQTHGTFGGTWLSDYLPNRLGVNIDEPAPWTVRAEYGYTGDNGGLVYETLNYPARRSEIDRLLKKAGTDKDVDNNRVFFIESMETIIPQLEDALPDNLSLYEINRAAKAIRVMTEDERDKFGAFIAANRHCGSIEEMTELAENIGGFDFAPRLTKSVIRVYIENVHDERAGGFTIPLPTTPEAIRPFLEEAEIETAWDAEFVEVFSDITGLGDLLNENIKKTMSPDTLDELNYLAARIAEMTPNELEIFAAAVEAKRHTGSAAEIISLTFAENIDMFDLQPAFSKEEYGGFLLDLDYDSGADAMNRLEQSDDPADRALFGHITRLESAADAVKYGFNAAKQENGVFTSHGYLTVKDGAFGEFYREPRDIPAEYRIFTNPGEIIRQPLNLYDVNIAAEIMKLHAVCGGNTDSAGKNLKMLFDDNHYDYLLLTGNGDTRLFPAIEAYKRGSETSEYILRTAAESQDFMTFAVRATYRGDGFVSGDLIQLNSNALRANISRHAVTPDRIDAVFSNGEEKSYDLWSWANLPPNARSDIQKSDPRFPESALIEAEKRYVSFVGANETAVTADGTRDFLTELNAAYMSAAENPQPGMIRVTNEAAREILAGGIAEVYRLTPAGAEKLAPIEAAKIIGFAENRATAIKRRDAAALDKWAERVVKNILRRNEREERSRDKNKVEVL